VGFEAESGGGGEVTLGLNPGMGTPLFGAVLLLAPFEGGKGTLTGGRGKLGAAVGVPGFELDRGITADLLAAASFWKGGGGSTAVAVGGGAARVGGLLTGMGSTGGMGRRPFMVPVLNSPPEADKPGGTGGAREGGGRRGVGASCMGKEALISSGVGGFFLGGTGRGFISLIGGRSSSDKIKLSLEFGRILLLLPSS
jgi:hypothetical protein